MMAYFLVAFGFLFVLDSFVSGFLKGCPGFPSKFITFSASEALYTLVLPTLRTGLMPSILIRLLTVSKGILSPFLAISLTVSSFITPISVKLTQKLRFVNQKNFEKKVKLFDRFRLNSIDNLTDNGYIDI